MMQKPKRRKAAARQNDSRGNDGAPIPQLH
jgi:hypothetical protein